MFPECWMLNVETFFSPLLSRVTFQYNALTFRLYSPHEKSFSSFAQRTVYHRAGGGCGAVYRVDFVRLAPVASGYSWLPGACGHAAEDRLAFARRTQGDYQR